MDEALGLLDTAEFRAHQTEHLDGRVDHCVPLSRSAADGVVLGKHDPAVPTGIAQPDLVGKAPGSILPLDVRHRMDDQSCGAQTIDDALAEAAVDEELVRLLVERGHRRRLSDAAPSSQRLRRPLVS